MNTIIVAIAAGVLLLWGGILGLLRLVDLFERRHILALGAYTTLVAGLVMGLVLFTVQERQKEHRQEMQKQMKDVTDRLGELSHKMMAQLEEKADLTTSEFEVRAQLQNEKEHHRRTRDELAQKNAEYEKLDQDLNRERQTRHQYQAEQNRKQEERFAKEEERYQGLRDFLQVQQRTIQGVQKQLASVQDETSKLNTQTAGLQSQQNTLLGKVNATKQTQELNAQKVDALARNLATLHEDLTATMAEVDSLYQWKKK